MLDTISTYAMDFVMAVALGVFIKYGVPYLKSLATAKNLSFIKEWVSEVVSAAEQTIQGSGLGAEKKAWAVSLLEKVGIIVDDTTDALIEAAVKAMNDSVVVLEEAAITAVEKATDGVVTESVATSTVESLVGTNTEETTVSQGTSTEATTEETKAVDNTEQTTEA